MYVDYSNMPAYLFSVTIFPKRFVTYLKTQIHNLFNSVKVPHIHFTLVEMVTR